MKALCPICRKPSRVLGSRGDKIQCDKHGIRDRDYTAPPEICTFRGAACEHLHHGMCGYEARNPYPIAALKRCRKDQIVIGYQPDCDKCRYRRICTRPSGIKTKDNCRSKREMREWAGGRNHASKE